MKDKHIIDEKLTSSKRDNHNETLTSVKNDEGLEDLDDINLFVRGFLSSKSRL